MVARTVEELLANASEIVAEIEATDITDLPDDELEKVEDE